MLSVDHDGAKVAATVTKFQVDRVRPTSDLKLLKRISFLEMQVRVLLSHGPIIHNGTSCLDWFSIDYILLFICNLNAIGLPVALCFIGADYLYSEQLLSVTLPVTVQTVPVAW